MNVIHTEKPTYSDEALETFNELEQRVAETFEEVRRWRGWKLISDPETSEELLLAIIREIYRAVAMYQSDTTEAGFHMFGRLPKKDVRLIQSLCGHKAEEAEHGVWAAEDLEKLGGGSKPDHPSPATFAVAAVWWRMAEVEEPLSYLGPEYLFEKLTALVTEAGVEIFEKRGLKHEGLRFVVEHATEDAKHAMFFKHMILDVVTNYPGSGKGMLRGYDYFRHVYPMPVWDEAVERALASQAR